MGANVATERDTQPDVNRPMDRYEIAEANSAQTKWTISLFADHFRLETAAREPQEVARSELRERVQLFDSGPFLRRVLTVKIGKKRPIFRLSPEAFAAVSDWIGPPTREDLALSLKRRFGWVVPVGVLFVVTALPVAELPWDPVALVLGAALIVTGLVAKWAPHRVFFALDSLWFSFLSANSIYALVEEWSWLRLGLLVLQLALVRSGWREYRRFAPENMAPEPDDLANSAADDARWKE